MPELLIGCGNSRVKKLRLGDEDWADLTTLDHDPDCGADVIHDLETFGPWPFDDSSFDEVHAYCVLEHIGRQGDYRKFFHDFGEIYRVLKPGGILAAHCPSWQSVWCWGDPSHTRVISEASLVFLDRAEYEKQIGRTAMTDFRWLWKGDLEPIHLDDNGDRFTFGLKAHKPMRFPD